jgi:hypothetical protein
MLVEGRSKERSTMQIPPATHSAAFASKAFFAGR